MHKAPETPLSPHAQARPASATTQSWRLGFENLAREHAFVPLRVEGTLPRELRGTFYRNGPGRFDVAGERYRHWFDCDGAVTAVRLDGSGAARGGSKLVATPWRLREHRARRRLFGAYDTPLARPLRELFLRDTKNPANTSVMVHDGRLYALCEGGKPFEMSTEDLSTIGQVDFGGIITWAFSAHPHRAPTRYTTYNFGLARGRNTTVECYALRDGDRARRLGSFALPGVRMNHDFAVTTRYLVFFFAPFHLSLWGALMGKGLVSSAAYRHAEGSEIVVVPIDEPTKIVRFTVPSFFMEHVVNAFEASRDEIVIDYVHYDHVRDLEDFVGSVTSGAPRRPLTSTLRRALVNPTRKTFKSLPLLDESIELPRVSPLVEASKHRFVYGVSFAGNVPPIALFKHDLETGNVERYAPGAERYPSEAVFVPRTGSRAEDDGWLLTLVMDAARKTSHLEVLDAAHLNDGPVARCYFDQIIPLGFHGIWEPAP